jgi:putative transposase
MLTGCTARLGCTPTSARPVVTEKTVADSMRRQGLIARKIKRRRGLTQQDKTAPTFPDLVNRDFTATAPNLKWCGDITEIPTADAKLYLATVIDLYSRRILHPALFWSRRSSVHGQGRIVFRQCCRGGVLLQSGVGSPVPTPAARPDHARAVVQPWCYDFYNHRRRHSSAQMLSPINYENLTADQPAAA